MKFCWPLGATFAGGLVLAIAATPNTAPAAQNSAQACQKVELIDRLTDNVIIGIEDIEIDKINEIAILSAHDRWALEDALATESDSLPQGGLYGLATDWTEAPPERISVENLSAGAMSQRELRPQGLALSNRGSGQRLFVVNHRYEQKNDGWQYSPTIEIFDLVPGGLAHRRSLQDPLICHPNAVAALGADTLLLTNDHGSCGWLGSRLEDLLPLDQANLVRLTFADDPAQAPQARRATTGFRFANGVAVAQSTRDHVYVADTRNDEIAVFAAADLRSETESPPRATLPLPGGPDNLRWAPDGRLITAAHPNLLTLGLYVKRWFGVDRAPSRVVAISPDDGTTEVLFDDPDGELISAATAAAVHNGWLLIGSAFDRGLVVCRLPGTAAHEEAQP